jgi:hypothetical protein
MRCFAHARADGAVGDDAKEPGTKFDERRLVRSLQVLLEA